MNANVDGFGYGPINGNHATILGFSTLNDALLAYRRFQNHAPIDKIRDGAKVYHNDKCIGSLDRNGTFALTDMTYEFAPLT